MPKIWASIPCGGEDLVRIKKKEQKKSRPRHAAGRLTSNDYNSTNMNKAMNVRMLNV